MLYPIATQTRMLFDLNGIWKFTTEAKPESYDAGVPVCDGLSVAVPGAFNEQFADTELRFYSGYFIYERNFNVSADMLAQRLVLRFGSVTHTATVYVNGKKVAYHKGGFLPFEAEINDVAVVGTNRLTVLANNLLDYTTLPVAKFKQWVDEDGITRYKVDENFDFFNFAGIQRPVRLYTTAWTYLKDVVLTSNVNGSDATINAALTVTGNDYDKIVVRVVAEDGSVVASYEGSETKIDLAVKNVMLWQPMNAYLYDVEISLYKGDELVDNYTEPFGVRTVEVKDGKFLINNRPFYFKGFGKHEDAPFIGRGLNEVINVTDLNLLKWMNANSFRTSHYPYSEEMMRLADREGFVVIDETPAVGLFEGFTIDINMKGGNTWEMMDTKEAHEQSIRELIARDKNHACVVMWSIANEPASHQEGAREYFEPMMDLARSLDAQKRPLTIVQIMVAPADKDLAVGLGDVICLNRYYGWYVTLADMKASAEQMRKDLDIWVERYPDKPIMYTEYGGDTVAGFHSIYSIPFTEEYQVEIYDMMAKVMDDYPTFVGEQAWNFADFETKLGINRVQGNKKGAFTRVREPKQIATWLKKRWGNIPDFDFKK